MWLNFKIISVLGESREFDDNFHSGWRRFNLRMICKWGRLGYFRQLCWIERNGLRPYFSTSVFHKGMGGANRRPIRTRPQCHVTGIINGSIEEVTVERNVFTLSICRLNILQFSGISVTKFREFKNNHVLDFIKLISNYRFMPHSNWSDSYRY